MAPLSDYALLTDEASTGPAPAFVVVGPAETIAEVLCGPHQHDLHCRAWRWRLLVCGNAARSEAVEEELRKMRAERREDEARAKARNVRAA